VVLKVLTDSAQVLRDGDAEPAQFVRIADAGLHQQFRSVDRAQRHDYLGPRSDATILAVVVKLHTCDPVTLQR
jgi:hypothetical protein